MWSKDRSPLAGASGAERTSGRALVATERALLTTSRLGPVNLVVLVRLDGPALDDLLPAALAALSERHPLLRARIAGPPARPRFVVDAAQTTTAGAGAIPLSVLRAADAERAYAVAEAEMNAPFDLTAGPLARLTCVSSDDGGTDLVLTLHHAIADGTCTGCLVHELLDWCRAKLAGEPLPLQGPTPLPPPLSEVLPASMRGLHGQRKRLALVARDIRGEITYRRGSRGRRPVPATGRAVTRPIGLDRERTASLVDRARRQRLTLTSLLTAGLLWQANAVLYGGKPGVMRAVVWVDLRPYLDPPVAGEVLGCYISLLRFSQHVDIRRGFTALAADTQREIERASRRGDRLPAAQVSAAMTRFAVRWPVSRLGTVALSHAAAPAIQPAYGPVSVREVRAFVSNSPIGAEIAAASGVWRGAFWCDLLYLDSDYGEATAAAIGDGLLATLRDFTGSA